MDKYLYKNLCELSVQEALSVLLKEFGAANTMIMFKGTHRLVNITQLNKEYANIKGVLASHIAPISFQGGPPPSEDYYDGSLLTMLCDKVLRAWHLRGEYEDLVESEVTCF